MALYSSDKAFLSSLNNGSETAILEVYRRYQKSLCRLVEGELNCRLRGRIEPEDPVQTAIRTAAQGFRENRYHVDHLGELWKLLATITLHKMYKLAAHERAMKHAPDREEPADLALVLSRDPRPEDVIFTADLIDRVLEGLQPPTPEVFFLRLQGYRLSAIAAKVGRTRAAVRYMLEQTGARLRTLLKETAD